MTDDYKNLLSDYITGNIEPTAPSSEQILNEIKNIPRSEFVNFLPSTWYDLYFTNIIQSSTNGNFILYGGYVPTGQTAATDSRGIIIILDQNMKPLKTIYEFASGTRLRPIQKMIQIEDGTFVAIDSTIFAEPIGTTGITTNEKRFIMLNNISELDNNDDYSVSLRKAYKFPSAYRNIFAIDIIKNPNSSHYLIAGKSVNLNNGTYDDGVRIIDLKINVGSSNTWSQKESTTTSYWLYGGFSATFDDDDNASYRAIITRNTSPMTVYSWDGTTITSILEADGDFDPYVDSVSMRNQVSFIDYDTVYFVVNNQRWGSAVKPRYIGLYKYTYSTGNLEEIYLKNTGNFDWYGSREGIFIQALNGELYINYCDNYNSTNSTANYNFQRLKEDCWDPMLIAENQKYKMEYTLNYTYNVYNLITNITMSQHANNLQFNLQTIKEIYNNLNYNSTQYINYNSSIPHTSVLYNGTTPIFARNLYNTTSYKNTTTSTIEIPNTMLNNIDIENKNLYGLTNVLLDQDTNTTTKNIYETLYINFINSINVVDEDTNTSYLITGTNITTNINSSNIDNTTMENKKLAKININFEDGTTKTQTIELTSTGTNEYLIRATIYVSDEIETIDIISNDETQTYITIEVDDLTTGQYYTLEESLRIE